MITVFLYDCAIRIYVLLIRVAAFFTPKAKLWTDGRKGWRRSLAGRMASRPGDRRRVAWFHAASLGEFEQGRPVIEAFREKFPDYFILLTFYSPSGYEIRKNYSGADYICYLPADTAANARDFVGIVKPDIAFFIKYEFWFNYLRILREEETSVILFAAIFRPGQVFFKWWGGFYRAMLTRFDAILVQNGKSRDLLAGIGIRENVTVAGDTRFDRVAQLAKNAKELPETGNFVKDDKCLVVGSAWAEDMEVVIPVLNRLEGKLKAVIAPHEIHPEEIQGWREKLQLPSLLYSDYKAAGFVLPHPVPSYLIIDNIGMLSALYRYGTMAYIGGAFGKGLHNTLEAATYGMPVFFGNRSYARFSEALELLDRRVARAIGTAAELEEAIRALYDDPDELKARSAAAREYVAENIGATGKVLDVVGSQEL